MFLLSLDFNLFFFSTNLLYCTRVLLYNIDKILLLFLLSIRKQKCHDLQKMDGSPHYENTPIQIYSKISPSAGLGGSVGCAVRLETRGRGFNPRRGRQHSFVEIDHEIFSMVILSLPLIQEGQLSVSGERMCTILVNRLED